MVTTIPQTTDLEQSLADTAPPPDYAAPHNAPPPAESAEASPIEFDAPPTGASVDMPLARLVPATYDPRRTFDEDALRELADSIRMHGLLEPIVVREITMPTDLVRVTDADGNTCPTFEVIAGARRCRACRLAGLDLVPVRVLTGVDDRRALQLAIVENLQRVDLDPIEQAQGYAALRDQAGMRQTAIAAAVKRSQTAIARSLGLLNLPDDVQELVRTGQLTAAHGAALERFSEFPAYVRAVADLAMRANWTSKRLAEEKLPVSYEMWKRNGVMRSLGHQAAFDVEVCKSCPFGAYRHAEYAQAYCLKPEHYDQLQADAQALVKAAKCKVVALHPGESTEI